MRVCVILCVSWDLTYPPVRDQASVSLCISCNNSMRVCLINSMRVCLINSMRVCYSLPFEIERQHLCISYACMCVLRLRHARAKKSVVVKKKSLSQHQLNQHASTSKPARLFVLISTNNSVNLLYTGRGLSQHQLNQCVRERECSVCANSVLIERVCV